jgi:hypothetical protein
MGWTLNVWLLDKINTKNESKCIMSVFECLSFLGDNNYQGFTWFTGLTEHFIPFLLLLELLIEFTKDFLLISVLEHIQVLVYFLLFHEDLHFVVEFLGIWENFTCGFDVDLEFEWFSWSCRTSGFHFFGKRLDLRLINQNLRLMGNLFVHHNGEREIFCFFPLWEFRIAYLSTDQFVFRNRVGWWSNRRGNFLLALWLLFNFFSRVCFALFENDQAFLPLFFVLLNVGGIIHDDLGNAIFWLWFSLA